MVGRALSKSIDRVERVARERRWNNPPMMLLVHLFVDQRMVKTPMNPINAEVCETNEERELQVVVPPSRAFARAVVHFRITSDFKQEARHGQKSHERDGA